MERAFYGTYYWATFEVSYAVGREEEGTEECELLMSSQNALMLLVRGLSFDSEFSPLEVIGLSCLETYFRTALILRELFYILKRL